MTQIGEKPVKRLMLAAPDVRPMVVHEDERVKQRITIQSETFTREGDVWVSEGVTKSNAPCRFLYRKNGSFTLSYDEKTDEMKASTRLAYDAQEKSLSLARIGDVRYTAVFGKEPCRFVYAVSSFAFDALATTESLSVEVNEKGGCFALTYLLTIGDVPRRIRLSGTIL